jgi:hypothetical protein
VSEAKVVESAVPFHRTWDVETKFVPVAVRVNVGLPTVAPDGESDVRVGEGLGGGLMVKVRGLEVPPPGAGDCTVMVAVAAVVRSEAGTCAVSDVLETWVVESALPFHSIWEVVTKALPDTVRVSAELPAVAVVGLNVVRAGIGFPSTGFPVGPPPLQPSAREKQRNRKQKSMQCSMRLTMAPLMRWNHSTR